MIADDTAARVARVARALLAGDDTITLAELTTLTHVVLALRRVEADPETIREVCERVHGAYRG